MLTEQNGNMAHHFIPHDPAKVVGCIVLHSKAAELGEAPEAESE